MNLTASTVPARFAVQAALRPDDVALACGERLVSYGMLDCLSGALAARLARHGVGGGSRVGLHVGEPVARIVALLAILKAGAAYVPFDPQSPDAVSGFMARDSGIALMLTDRAADGAADPAAGPAFWTAPTVGFSLSELLGGAASAGPSPAPSDPAAILYTSGSTGRPKGVVVPHRAITSLVCDADYASLGPEEVMLQLAPLAFDASTFEIWGALLNGARLVLPHAARPSIGEILEAIARHRVTTLWLTAGLFNLVIDSRPEGLRPLRQLLTGGDVLSPAHVARALRLLPGCRLINGYGPTENTTFTCCHTVRPGDADGAIPIGTPVAGSEVHILDERLAPVPEGEPGELCVGGPGLALGYLNLPELTAERFVANPFSAEPGARLYRTGDIVRRLPDGTLGFCGRRDSQIKLDGKRVEPQAVEAAILASPMVRDGVVCVVAGGAGSRMLVAHVVASSPIPAGDFASTLRDALRAVLPPYMVPARIVTHDALPLTGNGKIDRARLQAPAAPGGPAGDGPEAAAMLEPGPAPSLEGVIRDIWSRVLQVPDVALGRNFFDVGGTSLQLLAVHAALEQRLRRRIPLLALFAHPTASGLARLLSDPAHGATLDTARATGARQRDAFSRFRQVRLAAPQ